MEETATDKSAILTENIRQDDLHWFAFRIFNQKLLSVKEELEKAGFRTYRAMQTIDKIQGGIQYKEVPVIPGLLFGRTTLEWISDYKCRHPQDLLIYGKNPDGTYTPVNDKQMEVFILVTSAGKDIRIELLEDAQEQYKKGERVRIIDGYLKGAEGVIRRIKKDRKFMVAIEGVAIVAVAPIPNQYLERI